MLQYLLRNADFSGLFRFVSPNFFKVVSPAVVVKVAGALKHNHSDKTGFRRLHAEYGKELVLADLGVCLESGDSLAQPKKAPLSSEQLGERALTLFFHQILTRDSWILDFRSESFQEVSGQALLWQPQAFYYSISDDFLKGVRSLYRGFYLSDDGLFDQALQGLGLTAAKESLRRHFGQGDQSSVLFHLKTFQRTFTDVFEACSREKLKLQPEFFVLGMMLLGLYEYLESLGVPYDVRKCFTLAEQRTNPS